MRRLPIALVGVLGLLAVVPALAQGQARSGVTGTVLDTTCAASCGSECPPPPSCRPAAIPCPQGAGASIVCPLHRRAPAICTGATTIGCPPPPTVYPPYEGEAATVLVRRAGSTHVLLRLPVETGHFQARLAPGRYILRAHVALPCWTGSRQLAEVDAGRLTPVVLEVSDGCVAHPGAG